MLHRFCIVYIMTIEAVYTKSETNLIEKVLYNKTYIANVYTRVVDRKKHETVALITATL
jgi:hypothetical protein